LGVLRGIGYFFAVIFIIIGAVLFPFGIPIIIGAIIMMWMLHKGGQVTAMKKDMQKIRRLQEDVHKHEIEKERAEAENKRKRLERGWDQ
jgi:archaellum biogenesis protein FlaJ (TadC family)